MHVVRFDQAPSFVPGGHAGVINRAIAGKTVGEVEQVSVWHGTVDPDGAAHLHVHDTSAQVYVVLTGSFRVNNGHEHVRLETNDAIVIPAGEPHAIAADDEPSTVLVISAPALR